MFESFTDTPLEERIIKNVRINWEEMANTGDLLVSRRWTGYSSLMMLTSGSFASHVAMIVKDEYNIYVVESQPDFWDYS